MRYIRLFDLSNFLPSRRRDCLTTILRLHQTFQNRTIPLAFRRGVSSLLPLHIILPFSQPLQKDNNPSPRTTTLASLVKGEVLSPERIRATTGGIAFLPHPFRFSDTSVNNPSIVGSASHCNRSSLYTRELKVIVLYQPFQTRTIPCFAPPHLPPLSKGGGLTARHKLLSCCVLLATHPPFLFTKLFAVKTEGLLHHSFQKPHYPSHFS